jgi:hypothetical protein
MLAAWLGSRPSLGYPGEKYEMGLEAIEQIEVIAAELAARIFHAALALADRLVAAGLPVFRSAEGVTESTSSRSRRRASAAGRRWQPTCAERTCSPAGSDVRLTRSRAMSMDYDSAPPRSPAW